MNAHDRLVLITGALFTAAGVALGLFLPLPAGAATTGDPVERLLLDAYVWMAIVVAVLAIFAAGCWLIDRATARRDRRSRESLDRQHLAVSLDPTPAAMDEWWARDQLYPKTKAPGAEAVRPGATTKPWEAAQ